MVALANPGDWRVDRDDQPGEPGDADSLDDRLAGGATPQEIELVEHGPGGAGLHVFELVPRDGREDVGRAGLAGCPRAPSACDCTGLMWAGCSPRFRRS